MYFRVAILIAVGSVTAVSNAHAAFPGINGRLVFYAFEGGVRQLFSIEPDGSDLRLLSEPGQEQFFASFSADGRRIVFQCGIGAGSEICVMNADGSGQTQLTSNAVADTTPVFSPNGERIVFARSIASDSNIYVMSSDAQQVFQLTSGPASDFDPTWSPDGDHIAFTRIEPGGEADIIVYSVSAANFTNVTNDPSVSDRGADFSPDGSQITFVSNRDGNLEVYVMNADGSAPHRMTNDPAFDNVPAWSPDGKLIAFDSDRITSRQPKIYTVAADGTGELTQLTFETHRGNFAVTWQPRPPEEVVDDLIEDLGDLVESGALPPGQGVSLGVHLGFVSFFLSQGDIQGAISWLEFFIDRVEDRIRIRMLTEDEGRPLVEEAQAIIEFLAASASAP